MSAEPKLSYPEHFHIRVPPGFGTALHRAARAERVIPAEYARRVLLAALRADGVTVEA